MRLAGSALILVVVGLGGRPVGAQTFPAETVRLADGVYAALAPRPLSDANVLIVQVRTGHLTASKRRLQVRKRRLRAHIRALQIVILAP